MKKRVAVFLLVAIMTFMSFPVHAMQPMTGVNKLAVVAESFNPDDLFNLLQSFGGRFPYVEYMQAHADSPRPNNFYLLEASDHISSDYVFETFEDFEGMPGISVLTTEDGIIEWEVEIAEAGLYNLSLIYYNVLGRSSDIQRAIFINGELPFLEAGAIEFVRTWVNENDDFQVDNQGNEIRPPQVEEHMWHEHMVNNPQNGFTRPLYFYLEAGTNRISFVSVREPMLIRSLTILQAPVPPSFAEARDLLSGLSPSNNDLIRLPGQHANRRSSPMLFPVSDRSSPAPQPYSARLVLLNSIGGDAWSIPGLWIEWDFYVEHGGLFNIAMSVNQNTVQDAHVYRNITINGEHPFIEMQEVSFSYSNTWRVDTLGGADPFLFYLPAGHHTIRMEATMGSYATYLQDIQESVLRISALYRQIVMITGSSPDPQRDYQIGRRLPHLEDALRAERIEMDRIHAGLSVISGGRGVQRDSVIRTMSTQLSNMYANVDNTHRHLSRLQNSIGALGTWMMDVRNQPLAIDEIFIVPAGESVPRINNGIFARILHELRSLFFSFFIDYSAIGNVTGDADARTITVWTGAAGLTGAGRDQANVIRSLIDASFTPNTGINVDLMLVDMGTLLPATLSGQGPDVALMVGATVPMDFAMRGAVANLSDFPDYAEIAERFTPEGMVAYRFRDYTFALPVTQTFSMMFYRRDIMYELELDLPDTWDDVRTLLPVLSENHMTFGLPVSLIDVTAGTFAMFLYQAGGRYYSDDGLYSELDSNVSVNAFNEFTRFFNDFGLPQQYDFANRFRTGEMPLAIADFSVYNMLHVFAPELNGLWGFRKVPGTIREDGSIDHSSIVGGTALVLMERSREKDAAWEFMKWFTSADIQTDFGRGMESLMGAAARFPTANEEAFMRLPWATHDFARLMEQYEHIVGIPQVPGGYFSNRQIHNAFFEVVTNDRIGSRAALTDNVRYINEEIRRKRREFGLNY